jgi:hypothetical protein
MKVIVINAYGNKDILNYAMLIATEAKSHDGGVIANAATTLGGNLDRLTVLFPNEQNLLHEWLNRILASSGI